MMMMMTLMMMMMMMMMMMTMCVGGPYPRKTSCSHGGTALPT
jgi:hypothetical protein